MMHPRHTLFIVLGLALSGVTLPSSRAQSLRAELYTMGPGDELFTKFGHAALCVTASDRAPTLCFNYGTTDFSRPIGLTLDVLRGRAEFFVSVVEESDMVVSFQSQDRTIHRQTLPLSDGQVSSLADKLYTDARPENRAYVYDHFLDNCSTKPRDLIDDITGGALRSMSGDGDSTYRDLVDRRLGYSWLLVFMSDLFLGRRLDHETTPWEAMFLPDLLRDGVARQLESDAKTIYTRKAPLSLGSAETARLRTWLVMVGFAAVMSLAALRGTERVAARVRRAIGLTLGGLGAVLVCMVLASPESEIRYNENLLVFLPTDVILATRTRKLVTRYAKLRLGELGLVGVLAASGILLQPLWPFWVAAAAPVAAVAFAQPSRFCGSHRTVPTP